MENSIHEKGMCCDTCEQQHMAYVPLHVGCHSTSRIQHSITAVHMGMPLIQKLIHVFYLTHGKGICCDTAQQQHMVFVPLHVLVVALRAESNTALQQFTWACPS
jgi:hypothetical protein